LRPPRGAAAPRDGAPRSFWRAIAFGTTQWAIRRGLFILACGILGALVSVVLDGGGAQQGGVIGMVVGVGLLLAWFVLSNL
jgi:hypothetical protein